MSTRVPTGKLLVKLVLTAVAMFAFAIFVMPPLYNLLCEITGIGGKTKGSYEAVENVWYGAGVATVHSKPSAPSHVLASDVGAPLRMVTMTLYNNIS